MDFPQRSDFNKQLARALGYAKIGDEGLFQWDWSEDLTWPAYATGNKVSKSIKVPLIGSSEPVDAQVLVPEYKKDRMCQKYKNQWLITKWCAPESLSEWEKNFPGAAYPSRGFRIMTNAVLDPFVSPTQADTDHFIQCIKEQQSMTYNERLADMERDQAYKENAQRQRAYDEIGDMVPAFCNGTPGKRGGSVSMPSLQKEIGIGLSK